MDISIIIPTYNRKKKLLRLIDSILKSDLGGVSYEIIVVDDCSVDNTYISLKERYGHIKNFLFLVNDVNKKKSYSVNRGLGLSKGDYILIIDDDVIVDKIMITSLLDFYNNEKKDNYILSPLMLEYENREKIWFSGLKLNFWTTTGDFLYKNSVMYKKKFLSINSDAMITAFIFPRKLVEDIGFFNDYLLPFQFEEMDFCIRSTFAGYNMRVVVDAKLWHDHEKGVFLNSPWRLYFEVRNRIITAKLWSRNQFQVTVSRLFSLLIPCSYFFIKILYRKNYFECVKSIFFGMFDGLVMSLRVVPYFKRSRSDLKNKA